MNRKIFAVAIIAVLIIGGYGAFYAYESIYVVPEDLKIMKGELKSIEGGNIPESDINQMESLANQIQNMPSLKIIPLQERKKIANDLRNDPFYVSMNSTINELNANSTNNQGIASRYDILLKGNVAKDIRGIYSTEMTALVQNMKSTIEKMPVDIENGDNSALANDYREIAKIAREYNKLSSNDKTKLQNIINNLEG